MMSRMFDQKKQSSKAKPRQLSARARRCLTEALEDRRLFAASLVTVAPDGVTPGNGDSSEASVSSNGRYVAFSSFANNLVAGDNNNKKDVFLRDLQTGVTTMLSKSPTTGAPGDDNSTQPVINADGTHVAFVSRATNLLSGDTQKHNDIFRYTIANGALELVSARSGTTNVYGGGSSSEPTISKDGNLVSFTSFAGNLNAGLDTNGANDVFVRNMGSSTAFGIAPGATKLISVESTSVSAANKQSFDSWISSDGRYIAFRSDASNMTTGDTNDTRDTFVRDLQNNTTTIISVTPGGVSGDAASDSNSISGDGRYVTFQSRATNLVGNDGNENADVFLRDTTTNTTTLLSVNRFGTNSAGGFSEFPALSQDGSFASFSSTAGDIVEGDANGREDVFLRDLVRGPISLLSATPSGAPSNGRSFDPFISANGNYVVFTSTASDIASGDNNSRTDIFLASAPTSAGDAAPPTAVVSGAEAAAPGATEFKFTVNLSDDFALNTVVVGPLTVTKAGSSTSVTTTNVSVVGTGTSAVATYTLPFSAGINTNDTGVYEVKTTANAIQDASGKSIPGGTVLGTFTLAIGDPNGPDLVITKPGKLKPSYIGGSSKAGYKWKVQNNGPGVLTNATVQYTLYTSADNNLDAGDATVGTVSKVYKTLKPTKSKAVAAKFVFPNSLNGNYFVFVKADTTNVASESNETNNGTASLATTFVAPPTIDLQPTLVGRPSRLTAGFPVTVPVTIKNNGNVKFTDLVPVSLGITKDGTLLDATTPLVTSTHKLTLAPGQSKTVKLSATLPTTLPIDTYQIQANVDPANAFAEGVEDNNTALSFTWTSFQ